MIRNSLRENPIYFQIIFTFSLDEALEFLFQNQMHLNIDV